MSVGVPGVWTRSHEELLFERPAEAGRRYRHGVLHDEYAASAATPRVNLGNSSGATTGESGRGISGSCEPHRRQQQRHDDAGVCDWVCDGDQLTACYARVRRGPFAAGEGQLGQRRKRRTVSHEVRVPRTRHAIKRTAVLRRLSYGWRAVELDVAALDGAREAWRSGRHADLYRASIDAVSLGASLEGACWAVTGGDAVLELLERWSAASAVLPRALTALTTTALLPRPGEHDTPEHEVLRCPSRQELVDAAVGVEWRYFLDRFRRSLVARLNLPAARSRGIAAALREMVDNVVQHAGLGDQPRGVVAYEVSSTHFWFGVADLGRGVLASLLENPAHRGVSTDAQALRAAVSNGASGRLGPGGTGFADLTRALADLNGCLTFRSGSARLVLDGRGNSSRVATLSNSPEMEGFQLSVHAQPSKSIW